MHWGKGQVTLPCQSSTDQRTNHSISVKEQLLCWLEKSWVALEIWSSTNISCFEKAAILRLRSQESSLQGVRDRLGLSQSLGPLSLTPDSVLVSNQASTAYDKWLREWRKILEFLRLRSSTFRAVILIERLVSVYWKCNKWNMTCQCNQAWRTVLQTVLQ